MERLEAVEITQGPRTSLTLSSPSLCYGIDCSTRRRQRAVGLSALGEHCMTSASSAGNSNSMEIGTSSDTSNPSVGVEFSPQSLLYSSSAGLVELFLKYPSNQIELMAVPLGGKMSDLRRRLWHEYGLTEIFVIQVAKRNGYVATLTTAAVRCGPR